ncbi:MAG: Membrane protein [uncultured Campylobacterales bacterium]|uniref:Membrane protein n=1 Tax=uncultured Campylobacterales bacterium TaxID=352960 RepID=A0A6S6SWQ1_9BACT|nr:MAG: Membrane protein [uncultured Campylobacterales bacterium]
MKYLIFLLSSSILLANSWNKLFYFKDNKNIYQDQFFLSSSHTPKDELNTTINLLKSTQAKDIACNFPARYTYIKNHYKIPKQDLSLCQELNKFLKTFKKDIISLAFSSEYINSPGSAFGHIMVLLRNQNEPIELASAVHFAAKTDTDRGFTYLKNGLNGKYDSYFIHEPFFKKIYHYNTIQQRSIHIYDLNYSKQQIKLLLYHLFELRKAKFKYYFLNKNCASRTSEFLSIASKQKTKNHFYYLPIDTLKANKQSISSHQKLIPLINKLDYLLNDMNKTSKKDFKKIIKNNLTPDNNISRDTKQALQYYTTLNFKKWGRSFKNYDDIINLTYKPKPIIDNTPHPLEKSKPSNLTIGYSDKSLYLEYRPLFTDLEDVHYQNESSLVLLTPKILIKDKNIKLKELKILELISMPTEKIYYKTPSFKVSSILNRENNKNQLKLENELGVGRTFGNNKIKLNYLLGLGLSNIDPYLKASTNINIYPKRNFKIGLQSYIKRSYKEEYIQNKLFMSYQNKLLYTLGVEKSQNTNLFLKLKYNF